MQCPLRPEMSVGAPSRDEKKKKALSIYSTYLVLYSSPRVDGKRVECGRRRRRIPRASRAGACKTFFFSSRSIAAGTHARPRVQDRALQQVHH